MRKELYTDAKFEIMRDNRFQLIDILELLAGEPLTSMDLTAKPGDVERVGGLCPCGGIFAKLI